MNEPAKTEAPSTFCQARVSVLWGNRGISDFLANAGLGITGAGTREILIIDYTPGLEVDETRVKQGMDDMIRLSDEQKTPIKVLSYNVISIDKLPVPPK